MSTRLPREMTGAFLGTARAAAASPGEGPAVAPNARRARARVHAHARAIIQDQFRDTLRKLPEGGKTERRFRTKLIELQGLLDGGQYRPYVLRAAALVVGEMAKLGEQDGGLADQLCVKAGDQMLALALEVTCIRLGILKAADTGEGVEVPRD